jgi:hypothetical protein
MNQNLIVQKIHNEFDTAQDRILKECDKILSSLNIPTETQVERKAKLLKELGFINVETVKVAKSISLMNKKIEEKINLTNKQADLIRYYKQKYPLDKFITISELERICKDYKLVYAPASKYIRDIPEKNVLEMASRTKISKEDLYPTNLYTFRATKFFGRYSSSYYSPYKKQLKNKTFQIELSDFEHEVVSKNSIESDRLVAKKLGYTLNTNPSPSRFKTQALYNSAEITKIDKSGLFIAAPKSHFDLKGLFNKGLSYFNMSKIEIKDPVVFEFCKEDICRIVTKWGTDDDQSYLDKSLINETHN